MQTPGRIAAAIEVLTPLGERPRPVGEALKAWGRENRFAGAKDRAFIGGLVRDVLRHRASLAARMGDADIAGQVAACLVHVWGWAPEAVATEYASEPYGPGALGSQQLERLEGAAMLAPEVEGNIPAWLWPRWCEAFGEAALDEAKALTDRAPVDLRVNTLKTDIARAAKAAAAVGAVEADYVHTGLRLPVPEAPERAGHVPSIPAYSKGWLEVQDLGSQLTALAAGDIQGAQVLDYCAGGGGKTLSLAALMEGTGQIYAYDVDARRLMPTIDRARRAGVRNLQIRSPRDEAPLVDLVDKMDCVFVDAPCTGSGTWRRAPDTKWRLTEKLMEQRMADQDQVLMEASRYVKRGGALVYVVCSLLHEEGEARAEAFLATHADFTPGDTLAAMERTGQLKDAGALQPWRTLLGGILLSPYRTGTDGFYVIRLKRQG